VSDKEARLSLPISVPINVLWSKKKLVRVFFIGLDCKHTNFHVLYSTREYTPKLLSKISVEENILVYFLRFTANHAQLSAVNRFYCS
jgi:hypothetical protein